MSIAVTVTTTLTVLVDGDDLSDTAALEAAARTALADHDVTSLTVMDAREEHDPVPEDEAAPGEEREYDVEGHDWVRIDLSARVRARSRAKAAARFTEMVAEDDDGVHSYNTRDSQGAVEIDSITPV